MSDWQYISLSKPPKSGEYLVVARIPYKAKGKMNFVFLNEWDNDLQSFTYDIQRSEKPRMPEDEKIYAWLPFKQPPNPMPKVIS
ncbi:hypothetical protein BMT54_06310 [Pasteurellaceae bacterium 15-036681]|nr:hypothetical protein BMT54_06310 [Pasteurellaceae bacterium 15-036681]